MGDTMNMDAVDANVDGPTGVTGGPAPGSSAMMTASQFTADCYNMNYKNRGRAVIFNHKTFNEDIKMPERSGTDVDATNMHWILTEMGFSVSVKNDLMAHEIESYLVKVAKEDHTDSDCFACVILSHGEEGVIYGRDGQIQVERLIAPFKGHRCQSLAGKPKLFFIQACRGKDLDAGVEVTDARLEKDEEMEVEVEIRRIPTEADFLMAYSVVPGYFAWRNSKQGSWFIQALVEVLRENWKCMDLLRMMTRVCKKVAYDFESKANQAFMSGKKQIPCVTSMLTRDVYFTRKK